MNDIDIFWRLYPRKIAKGQFHKTWAKLEKKKILPEIEKLLKVLEIQKAEWERNKTEHKYIPYPSTWLNYLPWEDEIEKPDLKIKSNYKQLYPDVKPQAPIPEADRKIVSKEEFAALKRKINKGM